MSKRNVGTPHKGPINICNIQKKLAGIEALFSHRSPEITKFKEKTIKEILLEHSNKH